MDFLKKHYEKILLGVMLAGLLGVLVFMLSYIASDKSEMAEKGSSLVYHPVKQLADLDMSAEDTAIARLKTPFSMDLDTSNKLFNPMEWQKALDGSMIPAATKTGVQVAVVTAITPLYLNITLDSVTTNELGAHYVITVEQQAAATPSERRPLRHWVSPGDKANDAFELLQVKGADPANPDGLVLKLADSGDIITLSKNKPYHHVSGYSASLRYDPEKKVFPGLRVGDTRGFGGEEYTVVEVNQNELILEDQSNQKKTSLPFAP